MQSTIDETWKKRELKDRIIRISENLGKYLPADFESAISIIDQIVMNYGTWLDNFAGFFPTFVELYGRDEANREIAMDALERETKEPVFSAGARALEASTIAVTCFLQSVSAVISAYIGVKTLFAQVPVTIVILVLLLAYYFASTFILFRKSMTGVKNE